MYRIKTQLNFRDQTILRARLKNFLTDLNETYKSLGLYVVLSVPSYFDLFGYVGTPIKGSNLLISEFYQSSRDDGVTVACSTEKLPSLSDDLTFLTFDESKEILDPLYALLNKTLDEIGLSEYLFDSKYTYIIDVISYSSTSNRHFPILKLPNVGYFAAVLNREANYTKHDLWYLMIAALSKIDINVYYNSIKTLRGLTSAGIRFNNCVIINDPEEPHKTPKAVASFMCDEGALLHSQFHRAGNTPEISRSLNDILIIHPDFGKSLNNPASNEFLELFKESYSYVTRNMPSRRIGLTVFEESNIVMETCPYSNKSIPITDSPYLAHIKDVFLSYLTFDKDGVLCYKSAYQTYLLSSKHKLKTISYKNRVLYSFEGKNTENNYERSYSKLSDSVLESDFYSIQTRVNGYGTVVPKLTFLGDNGESFNPDRSLYLGVEFEIDSGGRNDENAHIVNSAFTNYSMLSWSTRDGSVPFGFELKTVPATIKYHMNKDYFDYENALNIAFALGYTGGKNTTCGLHIHVNASYFDNLYRGMGAIAYLLEKHWDKVVAFTRRSDRALSEWAQNLNRLSRIGVSSVRDLDTVGKDYASSKYNAINNNKRFTIEFRIFRSTLNPKIMLASVQFTNNICKLVKDVLSAENGLAKLFNTTFEDIINYENYAELKEYWESVSSRVTWVSENDK